MKDGRAIVYGTPLARTASSAFQRQRPYALAARAAVGDATAPVHACYSFPTAAGGFGEVGYDVDDDLLARYADAVERVVRGIEAGVFVPHPIQDRTDEEMRSLADNAVDRLIAALTSPPT